MQIKKSDIWIKRFLIAILGLGIVISIVNFFNLRSLWLDEALLSISIVDRNYAELLLPLERDQVAPIGFLFIENFFATLFGNTDWSLRIFPFLSFLCSIGLIYKLNKLLFKTSIIALISAALFCLNTFILYYSIEVKQYMSDTFICLLVLVSALSYFNTKTRVSLIIYTCISFLSVWFSNIAVIMLFAVGLVGVYDIIIKEKLKSLSGLLPIISGLCSFLLYYSLFIYKHPARDAMTVYWIDNVGFLYQDVFSWEFRYFLRTRIQSILYVLLEVGNYWIFTLFFLCIGFISNLRHKKALVLLIAPMCIHLGLSYFKLYPFDRRLILYLIPLLVTLVAVGIYKTYQFINEKGVKLPVYVLLIPLIINLVAVIKLVPIEKEEIKKSMSYINSNLESDDEIYVYRVSKVSFNFYKEDYNKIAHHKAIFYSEVDRENWSNHDIDLENLKPNVWLVFSHTRTIDKDSFTEKDYILNTLKTKGYIIVDNQEFEGTSVYKVEK
ncbi:hypothetical protein A9Q86_05130 [Flavobacteriales bacterium 33_180_T64]|nr:hypothetical protein A9Q86_05130 [Flavobacteriales bacterium 33_180_T64]